jgi:hypothetical protein
VPVIPTSEGSNDSVNLEIADVPLSYHRLADTVNVTKNQTYHGIGQMAYASAARRYAVPPVVKRVKERWYAGGVLDTLGLEK